MNLETSSDSPSSDSPSSDSPSSDSPSIVDTIFAALGGAAGPYRGITYNSARVASVEVLQTPNLWGHSPKDNSYWVQERNPPLAPGFELPYCNRIGEKCACGGTCKKMEALTFDPASPETRPVCQSAGDVLEDEIYKTIIKADRVVDISSLYPFPNGRFVAAIRNALGVLARKKRLILVRVLVGNPPGSYGGPDSAAAAFVKEITRHIPADNRHLQIFVSMMRTYTLSLSPSWNHSKIVAVDGIEAIVGGHNQWDGDYLGFAPIHDVSIRVRGSAVAEAHGFLNRLWAWVSEHHRHRSSSNRHAHSVRWTGGESSTVDGFPRVQLGNTSWGSASALSLGRLGYGIVSPDAASNASDTARVAAVRMATKSLRISQMDIAFRYKGVTSWPWPLLRALAEILTDRNKKVDVQIIVSHPKAVSATGGQYAFDVSPEEVVEQIDLLIGGLRRTGTLKIAALRFAEGGADFTWEHGGRKLHIGNHSKVYIIDDRAFYVGSDNAYPHNLQEFGYLVESEEATAAFVNDYWNKAWQYSSRAAVGG